MTTWDQAPCTAPDANPDDWHCYDKKRIARAVEACRSCPLVEACRQEAIDTRELHGVWGATTEQERRALFRAQRRAKATPTSTAPRQSPSTTCRSAA